MRFLAVALLAIASALGRATPAAASCAPAASLADNAARAVAVVYGTVLSTDAGALILRVDRTLKGTIASPLRVYVGPGRGGGGSAVMTSIDYRAAAGSDHVLYLIRGEDGELETNACIGSHPGPPDASEVAFFGAAAAPAASPTPTVSEAPRGAEPAPPSPQSPLPAVASLAFGIVALAAIVLLRRRLA